MELAALIAVIALAAVYEWRHSRAQDRFQVERDQWTRERAGLLQRIQAPEVAVAQHQTIGAVDRPHVPLEDDSAFWQAQDEQREALERMEELERQFEARVA